MTTDKSQDGLTSQLAGMTGQALLDLLNSIHGLHADQVAGEYGLTAAEDLARLRSAPDKDAMVALAEELKAEAEYQAFYPSGPTTEPDDGYSAFFPNERH